MLLNPDLKSRGSFITVYGANNLGKSTQIAKTVTKLVEKGHQSLLVLKYPMYEITPTGPKINKILKSKEKSDIHINSLEMQKLYAQNRFDFQPALIDLLNSGIDVICEDYIGTGIAWGLTCGLKLTDLEHINFGLIKPDYEILIDG